jgi:hypothetical protein
MFVLDPILAIPDPGSTVDKILDPGSGSASKNVSIFNPKNLFLSFGMFIPDSDFFPSCIPGQGVKKAPDPGSAIMLKSNLETTLRQLVFL